MSDPICPRGAMAIATGGQRFRQQGMPPGERQIFCGVAHLGDSYHRPHASSRRNSRSLVVWISGRLRDTLNGSALEKSLDRHSQ